MSAFLCSVRIMESSEHVCNFYLIAAIFHADLLCPHNCFSSSVWAEQGDEISLEYAGTYALKGDLVR